MKQVRISDGEADLTIDDGSDLLGKDTLIITMSNGGGFASLYITNEQWIKLVSEVKALIENKED